MIGNRVIFGCILLFLTLVIIISTAPIHDIKLEEDVITTTEPIAYENDSIESDEREIQSTTVEYKEDTTTTIPEVVTNNLLFTEPAELDIDIDEIIKMTDRIFSENQDELPSTPTTESNTFYDI
jgi:hypothetical protein